MAPGKNVRHAFANLGAEQRSWISGVLSALGISHTALAAPVAAPPTVHLSMKRSNCCRIRSSSSALWGRLTNHVCPHQLHSGGARPKLPHRLHRRTPRPVSGTNGCRGWEYFMAIRICSSSASLRAGNAPRGGRGMLQMGPPEIAECSLQCCS